MANFFDESICSEVFQQIDPDNNGRFREKDFRNWVAPEHKAYATKVFSHLSEKTLDFTDDFAELYYDITYITRDELQDWFK